MSSLNRTCAMSASPEVMYKVLYVIMYDFVDGTRC